MLIASLMVFGPATAQSAFGGFMDGLNKGYNQAAEWEMRDEQIKLMRAQRQMLEEERHRNIEQQRELDRRAASYEASQKEEAEKKTASDQQAAQDQLVYQEWQKAEVEKKLASDQLKLAQDLWLSEVASFKKHVKAVEGIDYDASPKWLTALNVEVRKLRADTKNAFQEGIWFLGEGHKIVKQRFAKRK